MRTQADTGSGKTLAFLVPAFLHILASPMHRANCRGVYDKAIANVAGVLSQQHHHQQQQPSSSSSSSTVAPIHPFRGPIVVVMAPTRELASQIHATAAEFADKRDAWLLQRRHALSSSSSTDDDGGGGGGQHTDDEVFLGHWRTHLSACPPVS